MGAFLPAPGQVSGPVNIHFFTVSLLFFHHGCTFALFVGVSAAVNFASVLSSCAGVLCSSGVCGMEFVSHCFVLLRTH